MKHVILAFIAWSKPRQSLREFSSRRLRLGPFTDLLSNSPKRSPWFSQGNEGKEKMFYFFKIGTPRRFEELNENY